MWGLLTVAPTKYVALAVALMATILVPHAKQNGTPSSRPSTADTKKGMVSKFLPILYQMDSLELLYGPCSHRCNNNMVVNWSGIDEYLLNLQLAMSAFLEEKIFAFYCDDGFASLWNCLRTNHRPPVGGPLSAQEVAENKAMKKV